MDSLQVDPKIYTYFNMCHRRHMSGTLCIMSRRHDGHVAALWNHFSMQPLWNACEQPGKATTLAQSAASSSMQIGHCAAAASSPPEAIEFTSQVQLSVDDAFRKICRLQLVPLAFSLVNCDDGWGADL